jgi:hypothetical protein
MSHHTAPWALKFGDRQGIEFIEDANGETVVSITDYDAAELIVRAVNERDALIVALREMLDAWDDKAGMGTLYQMQRAVPNARAAMLKAGEP